MSSAPLFYQQSEQAKALVVCRLLFYLIGGLISQSRNISQRWNILRKEVIDVCGAKTLLLKGMGLAGWDTAIICCLSLSGGTASSNKRGGSASDPAPFVHWEILCFNELIWPEISAWFFPVMPILIQP